MIKQHLKDRLTRPLKDQSGIAMVMTLVFFVSLIFLSEVFLLRTVNEYRTSMREIELQKAFYVAQAASQLAQDKLNTLINTYLLNTISNSNPNGVISYTTDRVSAGDGVGWLVFAVRDNNNPVLTQNGEEAEVTFNGTLNDYPYQYTILMSEKEDPTAVGTDTWDFPYNYRIDGEVSASGISQTITIHGDFTVRVQRDNFARYALFTNTQTMPNGTRVWFTDKTNFSGPVHTNDRFNIALNPSGIFEGLVTQERGRARYYNEGWPILLDADFNGTRDVPTFNSGFNRDVDEITLSSPVQQQSMLDQATGQQSFGSNGIYLPNDGTQLTGGIYVKGNSSVALSVSGTNPVYTISQGGTTKVITLDKSANQTTIRDVGSGSEDTYAGQPDGMEDLGTVLFVEGQISQFSGTVQADETVTVAASDDIIISDHVRYQNYTPASGSPGTPGYVPPSAAGETNLLGMISWQGDVRIGTAAPDNVDIHGTVLSRSGIFQVDDYNDQGAGPRGTATLLGGVISDNYGAFGLFNGSTGAQLSGYGRNFVYDDRMQTGTIPPYFPTLETFIAFTNDLTDKMVWKNGD